MNKKKKTQTKQTKIIKLKNGRDLPRVTLRQFTSIPKDTGIYQIIFIVPTSKCDSIFGLLKDDIITNSDSEPGDKQLTFIT